jgi:hypothetical protein
MPDSVLAFGFPFLLDRRGSEGERKSLSARLIMCFGCRF